MLIIICTNRGRVLKTKDGLSVRELADIIKDIAVKKLEDDKAENIKVADLGEDTNIAYYMILASANSVRHAKSLAENLAQTLKEYVKGGIGIEGLETGRWVLIDANQVIIHIFQVEARTQYSLEKLWFKEKE